MKTFYFFKDSIESIYCETSPVKNRKVVMQLVMIVHS